MYDTTVRAPGLWADTLDQFPLGVALLTPKGEVFYANRSLCRLTGHEAYELQGEGLYNLVFLDPDANLRLRHKALGALEAPFDDLDLAAEPPEGNARLQLHFCGALVPGPEGPCIVLSVHDVTHRKAYEQVIESSFDKFIQVTNALDGALKKIGEQNAVLEDYRDKMTREMAMAQSVQRTLVPRTFPQISGLDLYGSVHPTDSLGGDLFRWYRIDEDHLGLLIADVSGHGVPSSLVATMVKASFDEHVRRHRDPATVLQRVNHDLTAHLADTGLFVTAFYGVLLLPTAEFRVALAGHEPAWALADGELLRLGAGGEGTLLGVFSEARFTSTAYRLAPGTRVLACTDGIVEARSPAGEFFGAARLEAFLRSRGSEPARTTVEALVAETDRFFGGQAPNDDRTLWVLTLAGGQAQVEAVDGAKRAYAARDFQRALDHLEPALGGRPRDPAICTLAGQTLAHLGRPSEAAAWLEEAARLEPRKPKAWYYLGLVRYNLGDRAGAREAWVRVWELDPQYKDIQALLVQSE